MLETETTVKSLATLSREMGDTVGVMGEGLAPRPVAANATDRN